MMVMLMMVVMPLGKDACDSDGVCDNDALTEGIHDDDNDAGGDGVDDEDGDCGVLEFDGADLGAHLTDDRGLREGLLQHGGRL
jgi:hypothetical protein